ncbi:9548_t:CDS:2, partial [Funneliformis geosporum]
MSVATEGVEETLLKVTRETRQTFKTTHLRKIDELLENMHKVDVVEINLPDELGPNKESIHWQLVNSAKTFNTAWYSASNAICVVGDSERRPDV